jgi:hypothetical protein
MPLLVGRSIVLVRAEDPDVCELSAHVGLQIGSHLFEGVLREDVDHVHLVGRLRGNAGDFDVATFVSYYFSFCGIGWCWNTLSSREDKLRSKPPRMRRCWQDYTPYSFPPGSIQSGPGLMNKVGFARTLTGQSWHAAPGPCPERLPPIAAKAGWPISRW